MPIYEYQCQHCGHQLEALQKFSDAPLTECPKCNQASLQKLVSASGFQLKGSGWYVTDYRDKGKTKQTKGEGGKESGSDSSASEGTSGSDKGTKSNDSSTG